MNADINQAIDRAIQSLKMLESSTERLRKANCKLEEVNDALDAHMRRYNVKHHKEPPVRLVKGNGEY
jgi:hypothetical protein